MNANVSAVRSVPGRSSGSNLCRRCDREVETLAHVLGACPHGELLRNTRHHTVRSIIATALRNKGYQYMKKYTAYPVRAGMRRHYVRSSDRSQWIEDSLQLAMEHVRTGGMNCFRASKAYGILYLAPPGAPISASEILTSPKTSGCKTVLQLWQTSQAGTRKSSFPFNPRVIGHGKGRRDMYAVCLPNVTDTSLKAEDCGVPRKKPSAISALPTTNSITTWPEIEPGPFGWKTSTLSLEPQTRHKYTEMGIYTGILCFHLMKDGQNREKFSPAPWLEPGFSALRANALSTKPHRIPVPMSDRIPSV
ncbi:hypothetical protein ANN_07801 [Periplaneta americana]|uniref:Reverse transcriptase n=1 Tax=Periplaneta americana TaxID=6978 RepID=A0ABQ8T0A8_PERAM|nr:hypothetical protein ANN_07801 [Periplaneta americana]